MSRAPDGDRGRVRLVISGHVQGVWFRASTKEQADRLGVSGWVRNLRSGGVEVLAEGPSPAIDALIEWCRRGPSGARVDTVRIEREEYASEFPSFVIERAG